jgi:hypothetical protein
MNFECYREKQDGDADGLWEETFKTHQDTKPRGPASGEEHRPPFFPARVPPRLTHPRALRTASLFLQLAWTFLSRAWNTFMASQNTPMTSPCVPPSMAPPHPIAVTGVHPMRPACLARRGGSGGDLEPYRLYNLDVFDYELDETMALYGR